MSPRIVLPPIPKRDEIRELFRPYGVVYGIGPLPPPRPIDPEDSDTTSSRPSEEREFPPPNQLALQKPERDSGGVSPSRSSDRDASASPSTADDAAPDLVSTQGRLAIPQDTEETTLPAAPLVATEPTTPHDAPPITFPSTSPVTKQPATRPAETKKSSKASDPQSNWASYALPKRNHRLGLRHIADEPSDGSVYARRSPS